LVPTSNRICRPPSTNNLGTAPPVVTATLQQRSRLRRYRSWPRTPKTRTRGHRPLVGALDPLRATFRWKADDLDAAGLRLRSGASSLTRGAGERRGGHDLKSEREGGDEAPEHAMLCVQSRDTGAGQTTLYPVNSVFTADGCRRLPATAARLWHGCGTTPRPGVSVWARVLQVSATASGIWKRARHGLGEASIASRSVLDFHGEW
jgi:hypothetical protein